MQKTRAGNELTLRQRCVSIPFKRSRRCIPGILSRCRPIPMQLVLPKPGFKITLPHEQIDYRPKVVEVFHAGFELGFDPCNCLTCSKDELGALRHKKAKQAKVVFDFALALG